MPSPSARSTRKKTIWAGYFTQLNVSKRLAMRQVITHGKQPQRGDKRHKGEEYSSVRAKNQSDAGRHQFGIGAGGVAIRRQYLSEFGQSVIVFRLPRSTQPSSNPALR